MALPRVLKDMLTLPTAPFVEHAVLDYVRRRCAALRGVGCTFDCYGNLLAHYRYRPPARPVLAFSAHTDHPGFVALEMHDKRHLRAAFRGGVLASYFAGQRVRFWSGGRWIGGRVEAVTRLSKLRRASARNEVPTRVLLRVREPVEPGSPGMWALPDPALKRDRIHARGCDDVAGAAAMVALLEKLSRTRARAEVYCLFTRAEEVGFVGAIGACKARTLPKRIPIIAIETSSDRGGGADIGAGPVLRVGDKASTFTPPLTAFCQRVADRLARRRRTFGYQRKLMAGGTCESTAFMAYGYQATGVCLALGNYHNMDVDRGKIASEVISLRDWKLMVDWFEALVADEEGHQPRRPQDRVDMDARFDRWLPTLKASPIGTRARTGRRRANTRRK